MISLDAEFNETIVAVHGAIGRQWLENLPTLIKGFKRRWGLGEVYPFKNLSYNFVATTVRKDGTRAVLKLGVPCRGLSNEIDFLKYYDGQGTVTIIESDHESGALLLEKLQPGKSLWMFEQDERATEIAGSVINKLLKPIGNQHSFPHLSDWFQGLEKLRQRFNGGTGPLPEHLVSKAETLSRELLQSMECEVLLHGDLMETSSHMGLAIGWLSTLKVW